VALCSGVSGIALILISAASSTPMFLARNLLDTWAIIAASVTLRALRQVLVPRDLLGRVTAAWRLAGQAVTLAGAVLARAIAGVLGNDPRPVFAAAGILTVLSTSITWLAGLLKEDASSVAVSLLGK
jgi:hypothetical protein